MQQGKSCSPNDAKPSRTFPLHRMHFVSTLYVQPINHLFAASVSTEHQRCHFHPPAYGSRTKDNHGSHYGQHFVRLMTRATSRSTVAANKAVKQDASVQLPTSHVLPYATLEETAMQTSLMTAFESSSRFCVSCCNFIYVKVMNLLSPVGTLDCEFSELIVCIFFEGSIKTHISPFHTSAGRP